MSSDIVSASELVAGLEVMALDAAIVPTAAMLYIKGIQEDGTEAWFSRWTPDINQLEAVGFLRVAARMAEDEAVSAYEYETDPDGED
jgi:hypothetical protein